MCRVRGGISSLLGGYHHPLRGGICSQVAGAEALKVGVKPSLFHLNLCLSFSLHRDLCLKGEEC